MDSPEAHTAQRRAVERHGIEPTSHVIVACVTIQPPSAGEQKLVTTYRGKNAGLMYDCSGEDYKTRYAGVYP